MISFIFYPFLSKIWVLIEKAKNGVFVTNGVIAKIGSGDKIYSNK